MRKMTKLLVLSALLLLAAVMVTGVSYEPNVYATKDMYKAAKDKYGKDIKGCKHCHVKALPKEGKSDLNDRGQWLLDQKSEMGTEEVDITWLEKYKEPGS